MWTNQFTFSKIVQLELKFVKFIINQLLQVSSLFSTYCLILSIAVIKFVKFIINQLLQV